MPFAELFDNCIVVSNLLNDGRFGALIGLIEGQYDKTYSKFGSTFLSRIGEQNILKSLHLKNSSIFKNEKRGRIYFLASACLTFTANDQAYLPYGAPVVATPEQKSKKGGRIYFSLVG